MSISEIIIKIIGIVLALVGLGVILSGLGVTVPFIPTAMASKNIVIAVIVGILLIGFGIYIVRGGTPSI